MDLPRDTRQNPCSADGGNDVHCRGRTRSDGEAYNLYGLLCQTILTQFAQKCDYIVTEALSLRCKHSVRLTVVFNYFR